MAHTCVPTSSLVFSASPSSNSDSPKISLAFQPFRSSKSSKQVCIQRTRRNSSAKAVYSGKFWTPEKTSSRQGIWSIRDDLQIPSSPYFSANVQAQGPPPNPMVMERFQSVIGQLFRHRIIRCGGAVDDDMANLIVAQDIVMYVNSPGGSATAGMAIFDTMKHVRPDVSTVCVGLAASMGAFLLSAGATGKRFSFPNSRIMIHQPLGGVQGGQSDIDVQAMKLFITRQSQMDILPTTLVKVLRRSTRIQTAIFS